VVFQEPTWVPFLASESELPLRSSLLSSIHDTFLRSGVNPEMGPSLYRVSQAVGMPAPNMPGEPALGSDRDFAGWVSDLLNTVRSLASSTQFPRRRSV
jgi:hypothetical protein